MPRRFSISQVRKKFQDNLDEAGKYWLERQPADMGNHAGVVKVPDTENMVYVRLTNGQVIQVFNSIAPNIYNWKVFIGRDKSQPSLLKIIEVRWVYNLADTIAYVLFHHEQHEYPAPDTIWVRRDQFLPLLILPNGGLHIRIYGDIVYAPGMANPVRVADQADVDMTSYVPVSGARYVLVEVTTAGAINYVTGTTVANIDVLRLATAIPAPTAGSFPICVIEFYTGQTELRRDSVERNIIDLRMFTSNAQVDAGDEWHAASAITTLANGDEIGIWQAASSALKKITWQSLRTILDTLYDTFGSAATVATALSDHITDSADTHDASAISIADAGTYFTATDVEAALQEIGAGGIGGGGGAPLVRDDLTLQIPAVSDHYDLTEEATSDVLLFYNGVLQPASEFTMDVDNLGLTTDNFSPTLGDTLLAVYGGITGSGGASALADLTDVNLTTPSDGDILVYDAGTSKWIDSTPAAPGGIPLLLPSDVTGLQVWSAARLETGLVNNDVVVQLTDQSGNARHFTQATVGKRALYIASQLNTHPIYRFDSTDDGYVGTYAPGAILTAFIVYKFNGTNGDRRVLAGSNNWLVGPYQELFTYYANTFTGGRGAAGAGFVIQMVQQDSKRGINWINCQEVGVAIASPGIPGTIHIGTEGNAANTVYSDVAEICIYNKWLSYLEVMGVSLKLMDIYGI